jgi:hypothetical protein
MVNRSRCPADSTGFPRAACTPQRTGHRHYRAARGARQAKMPPQDPLGAPLGVRATVPAGYGVGQAVGSECAAQLDPSAVRHDA